MSLQNCKLEQQWHCCQPIRKVKIQNSSNAKCCKDVEQQELSFIARSSDVKCSRHFVRQFGSLLQNYCMLLSCVRVCVCVCVCVCVLVTQPCPALCEPGDNSLAGSSLRGTLQARTLE